MKHSLVRFGVAMEEPLLVAFDALVHERGGTRSELLRDLARAEVTRARVADRVPAIATLTIVYDHHVRDLTERLTEFQHALGEQVRSTLHIHMSAEMCLEVIVMRGLSDEIRRAADKLIATRGVKHGSVEIIEDRGDGEDLHAHAIGQGHSHSHAHGHGHHEHPHSHPAPKKKKTRRSTPKTRA